MIGPCGALPNNGVKLRACAPAIPYKIGRPLPRRGKGLYHSLLRKVGGFLFFPQKGTGFSQAFHSFNRFSTMFFQIGQVFPLDFQQFQPSFQHHSTPLGKNRTRSQKYPCFFAVENIFLFTRFPHPFHRPCTGKEIWYSCLIFYEKAVQNCQKLRQRDRKP